MSVLIKGMKMPKNMRFKAVVDLSEETAYVHTDEMGRGVLETCKAFTVPDHGDLIDRDELMKHGVDMPCEGGNLPLVYMSYVKGAKAVIPAEEAKMRPIDADAPTIDPVKHGTWKLLPSEVVSDDGLWGETRYVCSNCGKLRHFPYPYCPICGARMDLTT